MNKEEWSEWVKTTNRTEFIGGVPFTPGEAAHLRKHIGEQIAQEIESMKHTIVTIEGGISSHSLSECRSMRQQDYDAAQARYAAIARGKK